MCSPTACVVRINLFYYLFATITMALVSPHCDGIVQFYMCLTRGMSNAQQTEALGLLTTFHFHAITQLQRWPLKELIGNHSKQPPVKSSISPTTLCSPGLDTTVISIVCFRWQHRTLFNILSGVSDTCSRKQSSGCIWRHRLLKREVYMNSFYTPGFLYKWPSGDKVTLITGGG